MKDIFKQNPEDVIKLEKVYAPNGAENGYVLEKNGTRYYSETLESAISSIKGHFGVSIEGKPEAAIDKADGCICTHKHGRYRNAHGEPFKCWGCDKPIDEIVEEKKPKKQTLYSVINSRKRNDWTGEQEEVFDVLNEYLEQKEG